MAGLIVLFVAPGLALLGWFISLQAAEWLLPMLGVSALVGCVSIGLLGADDEERRAEGEHEEAFEIDVGSIHNVEGAGLGVAFWWRLNSWNARTERTKPRHPITLWHSIHAPSTRLLF